MIDATRIMASAIDHPEITYLHTPIEDAGKEMIAAGVSSSFAAAVISSVEFQYRGYLGQKG